MELNQLQYFRLIAQTENISSAAKILRVSQPSLSQTLKRLEQELGVPLFDRVGRNIKLNSSGEILLKAAVQIDREIENAQKAIKEAAGKEKKLVSIHMGCASTLLPGLLAYLQSSYPDLHFKINQSDSVNNHSADISICTEMKNGNYENILLLEEQLVLALPASHRLAQKEHIYSESLKNEAFIILSESWTLGKTSREILREINAGIDVSISVDNPSLMRELLEAGMGIAFVPSRTWFPEPGKALVFKELNGCVHSRSIYLSAGKSSSRPAAISNCIAGIQGFFKSCSLYGKSP